MYPPNYIIYIYPPQPQMPTPPRLSVQNKEFDLLGRVTKETWVFIDGNITSGDFIISYLYDANGNVISMTDQFGLITTYTYDALNRLQTLTDPDNDTTTYQYDAVGQLVRTTYPTGTMIFQTYNKANLLKKIENVSQTGQSYRTHTATTSTPTEWAWWRQTRDNLLCLRRGNRLTAVTYADGNHSTSHDLRNNLITTTQISGIIKQQHRCMTKTSCCNPALQLTPTTTTGTWW